MFGKNNEKTTDTDQDQPKAGGKGRPTPKRRDAEKRNQRPLVLDKKAAKKRNREARAKAMARQQAALEGVGDERYLPFEHRGEDRKFMRDYIDSRMTLTQWALPLLLVLVVLSFVGPLLASDPLVAYYLQLVPVYTMWVLMCLMMLEVTFYVRKINRYLKMKHHGNFSKRGNGRYVLFRMSALRASRRPKPAVSRGTIPFNPPL